MNVTVSLENTAISLHTLQLQVFILGGGGGYSWVRNTQNACQILTNFS